MVWTILIDESQARKDYLFNKFSTLSHPILSQLLVRYFDYIVFIGVFFY